MIRARSLLLAVSVALAGVAGAASCGSSGTALPSHADAAPEEAAPASPLPALATKGRDFVAARECSKCHQSPDPADGTLSGVAAPQPDTNAWPTNLTPDPDTGIDGWTDEQYIRAIREGIDDQGDALCPTMPRFADMGNDEAAAIVAYLRSLPPVHHYVPESTCPPVKPKPADAGHDAAPLDAATGDAGAGDAGLNDAPADG
jgi:mono/diheme cytochrome c family protein